MPTDINRGLPIAETFHSIQGEGTYVGTPMHFIRLAGCPVGKAANAEYAKDLDHNMEKFGVLLQGQSMCRTWDGRMFNCDTDFSCHTYKTVDELIGETWERHICLTGGEPLIHQKALIEQGFFQQAFAKRIQIHIETSGTIELDHRLTHDNRVWIAVAPKWNFLSNMIRLANEIKFLVDEDFKTTKACEILAWAHPDATIWLSPINGEKEVNQENVAIARKIQDSYPTWRLSAQFHKLLNLR